MIFPGLIELGDIALFFLRLVIGLIFIYHAMPKLKGARKMAEAMGMGNKTQMIILLGTAEALSGIALILGVLTQLAALVLAIIMVGAILVKKMKWSIPFSASDKIGWEFDAILLAANLILATIGGGVFSLLY